LTLIRFILILAPVTVHEHVPPSPAALKQLYYCSMVESGIGLILFLFTGRIPARKLPDTLSAGSTGGVCVFLSLLKDINFSPLDAMAVEVIPGHIAHGSHLYHFITDATTAKVDSMDVLRNLKEGLELTKDDTSQFQLIAEDVEDKDQLAVSYRAKIAGNLNPTLRPAMLQHSTLDLIKIHDCRFPDCPLSFEVEPSLGDRWSFRFNGPSKSFADDDTPIDHSPHRRYWSLLRWNAWHMQSAADPTA
jgi:hypothetical protein